MDVFENGENKASEINLMDFPFICRICLRRGDSRLFEEEDYLLDVFVTISKIDVRSKANFPKNVCNECIGELEDISLFINTSKYNDASQVENLIPKKESELVATVDCGTSQEPVVKIDKTPEEYNICIEKSGMCRICLVPSCLTPFEEEAHLMQLFQNITNIDLEDASNASSRNSICNKCINKLESISLFISLSLSNDMIIESTIGRNESLKTEICSEENAVDFSSSKSNIMKFDNISDTKEVKVENYFDESAYSYESKDLLTVFDIKEEILHSPVRENDQKGLEFCSETNSIEKLECGPCENKCSTENHQKFFSKGLEVSSEASLRKKQFKCDFCEKSFNLISRLQRHLFVHSKKRVFECDHCEKNFIQKRSLKYHLLSHTGEKSFKCDCCKKSFSRKSCLNQHMLSHSNTRPFKCDCCEKSFTCKQYLKSHLLTHTEEKPFGCDLCKKNFTTKRKLKMHSLIHTTVKPFQCNHCEKSYARKGNLKLHLPIHTGAKSFKCDFCEKSFMLKPSLKRHLLVHVEKKSFKCGRCAKNFKQEAYLQQHLLIHAEERPFKCDCCEKGFTYKHVLKQHMLTHTGEKPFKCDSCGKSFNAKQNLKTHMVTHTQ